MPRILIALTGGIASGKSLVLRCFHKNSICTINTDAISGILFLKNPKIRDYIFQYFPQAISNNRSVLRQYDNIYTIEKYIDIPDEIIDKKIISSIIWRDAQKRKDLEQMIHQEIKNYRAYLIQKFSNKNLVIEVPLLFEKNTSAEIEKFDYIISTICGIEVQKSRLITRNSLSYKEIDQIVNLQCTDEYRLQNSQYIINTNTSTNFIMKQVKRFLHSVKLDQKSRLQ